MKRDQITPAARPDWLAPRKAPRPAAPDQPEAERKAKMAMQASPVTLPAGLYVMPAARGHGTARDNTPSPAAPTRLALTQTARVVFFHLPWAHPAPTKPPP
ncbi:MAG: hypothetical protein KA914_04715 [Ottowia sp.]|nr:hypothetical protein [Ottowia sp.]